MRWIAFLTCLAAFAATELDVSSKDAWVDSGLDLRPGDMLTISVSGTLKVRNGKSISSVTAAGAARGFRDLLKAYPVNEAGQGALIGRIGSSDMASSFLIGADKSWTAPRIGRGLAHAEPIAVVMQRHHLRLWKAPFKVDGEQLWVGAATHDIGFDRDQRNNGVTHKIDPDVDLEREFVGQSLEETGLVAGLSYLDPKEPSKEARTATGATFHSDGRMLVIQLN